MIGNVTKVFEAIEDNNRERIADIISRLAEEWEFDISIEEAKVAVLTRMLSRHTEYII